MCNTDRLPGDFTPGENVHLIVSMKRVEWDEDRMRDTRLNELLSVVFKELFARYIDFVAIACCSPVAHSFQLLVCCSRCGRTPLRYLRLEDTSRGGL